MKYEEFKAESAEMTKEWYSMPVFSTKNYRVAAYDEASKEYVLHSIIRVTRLPGTFVVTGIEGNQWVEVPAKHDASTENKKSVKSGLEAI